jgi:hypothetical protein
MENNGENFPTEEAIAAAQAVAAADQKSASTAEVKAMTERLAEKLGRRPEGFTPDECIGKPVTVDGMDLLDCLTILTMFVEDRIQTTQSVPPAWITLALGRCLEAAFDTIYDSATGEG